MTTIMESGDLDVDRAEALVAEAREAFDRAVRVLMESCRQFESTPEIGDGDVLKSVRQLNGAFLLTMEMREKARVAGCKRFGDAGAGRLDLDAARAEIGLRLACLRGRRDGGCVSGGTG